MKKENEVHGHVCGPEENDVVFKIWAGDPYNARRFVDRHFPRAEKPAAQVMEEQTNKREATQEPDYRLFHYLRRLKDGDISFGRAFVHEDTHKDGTGYLYVERDLPKNSLRRPSNAIILD